MISFCVKPFNNNDAFEPYPLTLYTCEMPHGHSRGLVSLINETFATIGFFIAMFGSSVMYYKVLKKLSQRSEANLHANNSSTEKVHRQVAKVLITNGIVFFLCQIPYRLYSIHDILADTLEVWSLPQKQRTSLIIICRVFLYINSAVNPYIYAICSSFYKKAFLEAFGICKEHKKPNNSTVMTVHSTTI